MRALSSVFLEDFEQAIHLADVPDPCPYLSHQVATFRFGNGLIAAPHYRELLDAGYRRNGEFVYRPNCRFCQECQILRVPTQGFQPSREQRRVWRKGAPLFEVQLAAPAWSHEKLALYRRYLEEQHNDAALDVDPDRYARFMVDSCLGGRTMEAQYRMNGRLVGVGILDRLPDALSSVYFYFDPAIARLSPGTFSALYEIQLAHDWGLDYYYLGYYIAGCTSMSYKARVRPCQVKRLGEPEWRTCSPKDPYP
ncbi:MAG: arginyltransferase [Candidatus Hydrogenedentes bacterium]|nr:arginyltransferase [Candidatus Hydrogenedentota bacterium]